MKTHVVLAVMVLVAAVVHVTDAGPPKNCQHIRCPTTTKTVCAENLRSVKQNFRNECAIKLHNCKNKERFKKLHDGKCKVYGRPKG